MKRGAIGVLVGCLALLWLAGTTTGQPRQPVYVGARVCGSCHDGAGMGGQLSLWLESKHSRAYASLFTTDAWEMAELSGIPGEPRITLETLSGELPADDPFLVTTAPEALGGAYLSLAQDALAEARFDTAEDLAQAGLGESPASAALADLLREIPQVRLMANVQTLGTLLETGSPADTDTPRNLLAAIQSDAGAAYPEHEGPLLALAEQRIASAEDPNAMSSWAGIIFEREFVVASAAVPGKPCTASLAGFGSRGARGICFDMLDMEIQGPVLVVIPPRGNFGTVIAMGKYEVSMGEWNAYCRLSGQCEERSDGNAEEPVTNIALDQARNYATWLSGLTNFEYRLPSVEEWQYAAEATGERTNTDDNCLSSIRGGSPRDVKQGRPNAWGVVNFLGNAQEWATTASGIEVKGGSYRDSLALCTVLIGKDHNGERDATTGFRLVREVSETG